MEMTGQKARATKLRVYASGKYIINTPNKVAASVQLALGADGCSIQEQTGKWHGKSEPGFIVECISDKYPFGHPLGDPSSLKALEQVEPVLQMLRAELDLTFYVTAEPVWAMEIF